jgi:hypothetical protein
MRRPHASVGFKVFSFFRMPIARRENRQTRFLKFFDVAIQRGYDSISVGDRESAAGTKIILHVDDQQRVFVLHRVSL